MSSTFIIRLVAIVAAVFALALAASATKALAFTPTQTTVSGVVNVEYWDLDKFWRANFNAWGWSRYYTNPYVRYYNPGPYSNFLTNGCGSTGNATFINDWGVYCAGSDRSIYLNVTNVQSGINRYRDGGAAFLVAHEFAHHIQGIENRLGYGRATELNADCLAGMYFRWGVTQTRVLDSFDLAEARYTIYYAFGGDPAGHGTGAQRLGWFDFGYQTYDLGQCNRSFSVATGARAPSGAKKKMTKRLGTRSAPTTPVVTPVPTGA
jgi:predicted metalloprotease